MVKHNNIVPNNHFRKLWDQPVCKAAEKTSKSDTNSLCRLRRTAGEWRVMPNPSCVPLFVAKR